MVRWCSANGRQRTACDDEGADQRRDVPNSRMIAYPFWLCVLPGHRRRRRADPHSADRAKDFPKKPVDILGTGESVETPMVARRRPLTSRARSGWPVRSRSRRPVSRTRMWII